MIPEFIFHKDKTDDQELMPLLVEYVIQTAAPARDRLTSGVFAEGVQWNPALLFTAFAFYIDGIEVTRDWLMSELDISKQGANSILRQYREARPVLDECKRFRAWCRRFDKGVISSLSNLCHAHPIPLSLTAKQSRKGGSGNELRHSKLIYCQMIALMGLGRSVRFEDSSITISVNEAERRFKGISAYRWRKALQAVCPSYVVRNDALTGLVFLSDGSIKVDRIDWRADALLTLHLRRTVVDLATLPSCLTDAFSRECLPQTELLAEKTAERLPNEAKVAKLRRQATKRKFDSVSISTLKARRDHILASSAPPDEIAQGVAVINRCITLKQAEAR